MADLGAWFSGERAIPGQPALSPDDEAPSFSQGDED